MKREPQPFRKNFTSQWLLPLAMFCAAIGSPGMSQEAKVAASSLQIRSLAGDKKIEVEMRLVDAPKITLASASTEDGTKKMPTTWAGFDSLGDAKCAWLVVIDNSNPARQKTVEACVHEVRQFLSEVPETDPVMLATLARDLVVAAPFGEGAAGKETALSAVKAEGASSMVTLIYQNLRQALTEHLEKRGEARKAVLLFTDGKDETPGGPDAIRSQRDEMIAKARELGVVVHTIGFAENPTEANWFSDLKEASLQTEGLHVAAENRQLPAGTWQTISGVMHGGGTATVDVAGLEKPEPLRLELRTAAGQYAVIPIEVEKVAAALPSLEQSADPASEPGMKPEEPESPAAGPDQEADEEEIPPARPDWFWWAVGGAAAVLLAVIFILAARRRAAEEARRVEELRMAEQARILNERLAQESADPATVKAAPAPLAYLEMCDAQQTRHPVTVTNLRIGRGQHNDLVLRNDSVSGNHCTLTRDRQGEWVITDLKSGNGVIVNGSQVKEAVLRQGDVIELGDLKMRFLQNF